MLSRENKVEKIARFGERVEQAQAVIIAENTGLTVSEMEALRQKLRESGGSAQVVKNTLAKRVLESSGGGRFAALNDHLKGPLIYGIGDDAAKVAKIFVDVARDNPKLVVRGGALPEKAAMDVAAVTALAKLPSREQLLAKLMGTMQAPIANFVGVLHAVPSGFVRALAAVRDQKAEGNGGN